MFGTVEAALAAHKSKSVVRSDSIVSSSPSKLCPTTTKEILFVCCGMGNDKLIEFALTQGSVVWIPNSSQAHPFLRLRNLHRCVCICSGDLSLCRHRRWHSSLSDRIETAPFSFAFRRCHCWCITWFAMQRTHCTANTFPLRSYRWQQRKEEIEMLPRSWEGKSMEPTCWERIDWQCVHSSPIAATSGRRTRENPDSHKCR